MNRTLRAKTETRALRTPIRPRFFIAMILSFALLAVIGYAGQSVISRSVYPIRKVSVEGNFRFLTPSYIQTLVTKSLDGGFFQIDVQKIRRQLLEEPWIFEATVERIWPDVIRVAVQEQIPVARWGRSALLNRESDIFAPNSATLPAELPLLNGPVGSESEVLSEYREMTTGLADSGLKIAGVSLSERGAWTITLQDDTQLILGRHDIRRRFERFCASFGPLLKADWSRIAKVDLRFTNGFAVTERAAPEASEALQING